MLNFLQTLCLTPGGRGGIDLAKGILEIEFCLDQIKIYFSCLWP